MRISRFANIGALAAGLLLGSLSVHAADKPLLHCFTFTAIPEATQADWAAFYKASDNLPSKIPGVTHVWYGKLQRPQTIVNPGQIDDAARKKFGAGETITAPISRVVRQYGMCMEMTGESALKDYEANPYHKTWVDAYSKVRVEGTTTFNILGQ